MATRRKLTAEIWHKGLILPWQNLHNQRFCYTFATEINCQDKYIMNENRIIGRNLKSLREANSYTQEQVASYLGINRSAYANYETGEREVPIDVLEKACNLFGCEMELLFDKDEKAVRNMLVCAFRADNLSENDLKEVSAFKEIVLNYMKMERLLAE